MLFFTIIGHFNNFATLPPHTLAMPLNLTSCHSKGLIGIASLNVLSALSTYMCYCSANIAAKISKVVGDVL